MAEYRAFKCDLCSNIIEQGERTRRIVRLEGPTVEGEYKQDLCASCVTTPEGVKLRPLRRRSQHDPATPVQTGATAPPQAGE